MSRIEEIIDSHFGHQNTGSYIISEKDIVAICEQYGKELLEKAAENAFVNDDVGPGGDGWTCSVDKSSILNTTL